ncbi:MAG: cyclase family protein [candidate division KSB1 bacterium]|nr:cyclase family protein [candidate division KSB1 bacterium]MDZ7392396.1 cyclase family protein [candidate division KSB1 bacterium]
MRVYDCSVALKEGVVIYPGDPPFRAEWLDDGVAGGGGRLRRLSMSTHTGTHVDAPAHVFPGGRTLDQFPLDVWLGQVRIAAVPSKCHVTAEDLRRVDLEGCTRVFIKTSNSLLWDAHVRFFVKDYVYLAPDAARYLADLGLVLLGFDYLSVDKFGDQSLPAHKILLGQGIPIVEALNLAAVTPGDYEVVCAPLLLAEAEGAPARVFLLEE